MSPLLLALASLLSLLLNVSGQTEVEVGDLPNLQHAVGGTLFLVGTKSLKIKNFRYDGLGPDVFLYYYPPGVAPDRNGNGLVIPVSDEMITFDNTRYTGQEVTFSLPVNVTACDIGTLTMWCRLFRTFFTRIEFPRSLFFNEGLGECILMADGVPPTVLPTVPTEPVVFENCEELESQTQVRWTVDYSNREIIVQLRGCEAADRTQTDYLAFGLSGSSSSVFMFQADPVVTWVDDEGPHAVDYYLSGYFQCRGGQGACPDALDRSGECNDNATVLGGGKDNGVQWITYKRPFAAGDSTCDKSIDPSNDKTYVVWAVGPLGQTAFRHTRRANFDDPPFHFGRSPSDNCTRDVQCQRTCGPFSALNITALEDATFVARIGPSGLDRGYSGITGRPAWGIAWYINGTLIPELVVQRGRTYTFLVEGGNDTRNQANYHPLYITDSIRGGYSLNTVQQQTAEMIFAGFDENGNLTKAGRRCNYEETDESNKLRQECSTDLQEYTKSLSLFCEEGDGAVITWTPDDKTPDLVYYQCAVHLNLGWRIHVRDAPAPTTDSAIATEGTTVGSESPRTEGTAVGSEGPQTEGTAVGSEGPQTEGTPSNPLETTSEESTPPAPTTEASCPVECSFRYCSSRNTRRSLCSNPSPQPSSNCSACHLTYCHACYNYLEPVTTSPGNCNRCSVREIATGAKCFRRWATCVRRAHVKTFSKVRNRDKSQENFACHNPVCK